AAAQGEGGPVMAIEIRKIDGAGTLRRQAGTTIWHLRYWVDGQERNESAHTDDERVAAKLLRLRVGQIEHDPTVDPPKGSKVRMSELLDDVVADYERRKHRSLPTLQYRLRRVRMFFDDRKAVAIDNTLCGAYAKERKAEGRDETTVNRELAIIRRAFRLALIN